MTAALVRSGQRRASRGAVQSQEKRKAARLQCCNNYEDLRSVGSITKRRSIIGESSVWDRRKQFQKGEGGEF